MIRSGNTMGSAVYRQKPGPCELPKVNKPLRAFIQRLHLLLFGIIITLRWPLFCKCGSHPEIPTEYETAEQRREERGVGVCLFWKASASLTLFPRAWPRPRIGVHLHQRSLVWCQLEEHLRAAAQFLPTWRVRRETKCSQGAKQGWVTANARGKL